MSDASQAEKATNGPQTILPELPTWDGPDDPANPYNWPSRRKIAIGIICSGSQLVTTMSASMIAPALDQILHDLHMAQSVGQIAFSVFFLGLGFAPFLVAPLAETYGRKHVWLAGNVWYLLWNSICPVGKSQGVMVVGRLMSAAGASVGITLTAPVLADMYTSKDRGKSMAIAGILPYLGPALGPIVGGLAAQHLEWPWLFWILSFTDAAFMLVGIFVIRETYAPVLLRRKHQGARLTLAQHLKEVKTRLFPSLVVPLRLLFLRPVILVIAVCAAVEFGIYTLVLSSFASLWTTRYHDSETTASLHYISIAIGAFLTSQVGAHVMDYIWRRMKAKHPDREPVPEYRLPYITFGLVPCTAGIFWYAWAAERMAHWAVVDAGILIFTAGGFMFAQGLMAYQFDEFTSSRAASASAATRMLTYVLGFVFPIFAPQLYEALGYGWGNSLLGFLFLVLCVPLVLALWGWGERIRAIGRTGEDEKERITG